MFPPCNLLRFRPVSRNSHTWPRKEVGVHIPQPITRKIVVSYGVLWIESHNDLERARSSNRINYDIRCQEDMLRMPCRSWSFWDEVIWTDASERMDNDEPNWNSDAEERKRTRTECGPGALTYGCQLHLRWNSIIMVRKDFRALAEFSA